MIEITKVNLSTPFLTRCRCKLCGSYPSVYYFTHKHILWLDVNDSNKHVNYVRNYIKRMSSDRFLLDDGRYFSTMGQFTHNSYYKGYRPKLHRTRNNAKFEPIEYLTCECGGSTWAFNQRASLKKPEIFQRKSRVDFPNKFIF